LPVALTAARAEHHRGHVAVDVLAAGEQLGGNRPGDRQGEQGEIRGRGPAALPQQLQDAPRAKDHSGRPRHHPAQYSAKPMTITLSLDSLPALENRQRAVLLAVIDHCTVHNSIRQAPRCGSSWPSGPPTMPRSPASRRSDWSRPCDA
jgi:hypothetical protein